ncbi:MAG: glycosyltransferase, partial [Bdellovibrionales bacterium]|nr:glycosyltransferase [Bdellovibrionales bacterium]
MPKITVYIPSRNYGHFLPVAIESVMRQIHDDWELLLIDD